MPNSPPSPASGEAFERPRLGGQSVDNPPGHAYNRRILIVGPLLRWLLACLARQPAAWIAAALCWCAGAILPRLSPLSLGPPSEAHGGTAALLWIARWSAPATVLGAATALALRPENSNFLQKPSATELWLAQASCFALAAWLGSLLLIAGALGPGFAGVGLPGWVLCGSLLAALHSAALASILSDLRLPASLDAVALIVLTLLGARSYQSYERGWLALLEVSAHPMRCAHPDPWPHVLQGLAPVAALLFASWRIRCAAEGKGATPR